MQPKKEYKDKTMKRIYLILIALVIIATEGHAVLKEKNLEQTLNVLRYELTEYHQELASESEARKEMTQDIIEGLKETFRRSNQNSLMLYSQQSNYVFDLTYACHEATEQYHEFQQRQLPFQTFLNNNDVEIAKYDSLIVSLKAVRPEMLTQQAKTDRSVCITLATSIKNTLEEHRKQVADYISLYHFAEQRLKSLNDYANMRYGDIQMGIFMNGGENYLSILKDISKNILEAKDIIIEKYKPNPMKSDWDSAVIIRMFAHKYAHKLAFSFC